MILRKQILNWTLPFAGPDRLSSRWKERTGKSEEGSSAKNQNAGICAQTGKVCCFSDEYMMKECWRHKLCFAFVFVKTRKYLFCICSVLSLTNTTVLNKTTTLNVCIMIRTIAKIVWLQKHANKTHSWSIMNTFSW